MNIKRKITDDPIQTKHAVYVMNHTYRVMDNHSLYFIMNHYDTFEIVVFRQLEDERQNAFFDSFKDDLVRTLEQFGPARICYNVSEIDLTVDIVLDKSYLKEDLLLENHIKEHAQKSIHIIESNVVVPITLASNKEEYSARTIRPKIHRLIQEFTDPVMEHYPISEIEQQAQNHLQQYIQKKLNLYHLKNHPELDYTSNISVYLKYGILSPVRLLVLLEDSSSPNKDLFIEEAIIRRELAYNFVLYNEHYDQFEFCTYEWAYTTMKKHLHDEREYLYTIEDYIHFRTHDEYFNAAMKEMVYLGYMHGYMRMYWCKKIIEWSSSYKEAYQIAITLNNYYFLDGNTPNGYCGVAWCFGKHDRAWTERPVFGKLRYMNQNGLNRKFNMSLYVANIERKVSQYESSKT